MYSQALIEYTVNDYWYTVEPLLKDLRKRTVY